MKLLCDVEQLIYFIGLIRRQEALWREAWAGVQIFYDGQVHQGLFRMDSFFSYFMYSENDETKPVKIL